MRRQYQGNRHTAHPTQQHSGVSRTIPTGETTRILLTPPVVLSLITSAQRGVVSGSTRQNHGWIPSSDGVDALQQRARRGFAPDFRVLNGLPGIRQPETAALILSLIRWTRSGAKIEEQVPRWEEAGGEREAVGKNGASHASRPRRLNKSQGAN